MNNEELKSRILMEMNAIIGNDELRKLKSCLDRNFYGMTVVENTTEVAIVQDVISNDDMLKRFVLEKTIEGLSRKTLEQYIRETRRFLLFVNLHYSNVTHDAINFYLASLLSGGVSPNTVDNARKFIKPFFKWLYENEFIARDIFMKIKPIKRQEKQKEFLTADEIVHLRDVCQEDKRSLALVDFLLSTGVRVSECTNVKLEDVNLNTGEVNIYATKTGMWRKVYLDPNALKHLNDYLKDRNDDCEYVFVNTRRKNNTITRMKNSAVEKIVQKYCGIAQIHKKCTVHLFRKTLATRLYKRGADISVIAKLLGHNTVKTTEKYYLTICDQDIKYIYAKCV